MYSGNTCPTAERHEWQLGPVTLLTVLVALAVEPVCSVTPEELPRQGETLVIGWNETLLVAEGEVAVLKRTITVQGNGTVTPVFRIANSGELRVGENATTYITQGDSGNISGPYPIRTVPTATTLPTGRSTGSLHVMAVSPFRAAGLPPMKTVLLPAIILA